MKKNVRPSESSPFHPGCPSKTGSGKRSGLVGALVLLRLVGRAMQPGTEIPWERKVSYSARVTLLVAAELWSAFYSTKVWSRDANHTSQVMDWSRCS